MAFISKITPYLCRMFKANLKWILLVLLALIWGASFLLMKKGMYAANGDVVFSDVHVGGIRVLLASLSLLPFAIVRVRKSLRLKDWLFLTMVGCFGNFIPAFLFTYAETQVSSGYAGMLNSATPIFAILIGLIVFKRRLSQYQIVGVLIGALGVVLLMLNGGDLSSTGSWLHMSAVILATFCYGISVNVIREKLPHLKSIDIASVSFMILLLPSLLVVYFSGVFDVLQHTPGAITNVGYIAILSLVGTSAALIIFNSIIKLSTILFATSVTYLIPIIAVLLGVLVGEDFNWQQLLSMVVVLSGIFIANSKSNRKSVKEENN